MDRSDQEVTVPPLPILTYVMSDEGLKKRLRYTLLITGSSIICGVLILCASQLVTLPNPILLLLVFLAKAQLVLSAALCLLIIPNHQVLRSMRIDIQGTEIRQYGKKGKLLVHGTFDQITSLRTIKSILNRRFVTYVMSFGKLRVISFVNGMNNEDELISTIERLAQKRF